MSESLINEISKRYTNLTKSNAVIYHSEDGAPTSTDNNRPHVEGKGYHYITELVRAELISAFMKLQTLLSENPNYVNQDLEITKDNNLSIVTSFTRTNKSAIIDSIDAENVR